MTTIETRPPAPSAQRIEQSLEDDHHVLRSSAALIDLSDVGLVRVCGPTAQDLVQALFTRDIEFLTPERSITGLLLDEAGAPVDVVSCFIDDEGIVLRTSFGCGPTVAEHIRRHAGSDVDLQIDELDLDVIGVEGPYAWSAIGEVLDPDLASLPFESVMPLTWEDHDIVFSRTGLTGEYGYQLVGSAEAVAALRDAFAGSAVPVGREVVETAMLEVRQPLLSRELSDGAGVVAAGLQWLVDVTKPAFLGRDALLATAQRVGDRRTIGGEVAGMHDDLTGTDVVVEGEVVGTVVWSVRSPGRGATLALARVIPELAASGLELGVSISGQVVALTTLSSPYVVPASWGVPIL